MKLGTKRTLLRIGLWFVIGFGLVFAAYLVGLRSVRHPAMTMIASGKQWILYESWESEERTFILRNVSTRSLGVPTIPEVFCYDWEPKPDEEGQRQAVTLEFLCILPPQQAMMYKLPNRNISWIGMDGGYFDDALAYARKLNVPLFQAKLTQVSKNKGRRPS